MSVSSEKLPPEKELVMKKERRLGMNGRLSYGRLARKKGGSRRLQEGGSQMKRAKSERLIGSEGVADDQTLVAVSLNVLTLVQERIMKDGTNAPQV